MSSTIKEDGAYPYGADESLAWIEAAIRDAGRDKGLLANAMGQGSIAQAVTGLAGEVKAIRNLVAEIFRDVEAAPEDDAPAEPTPAEPVQSPEARRTEAAAILWAADTSSRKPDLAARAFTETTPATQERYKAMAGAYLAHLDGQDARAAHPAKGGEGA